MNPRYTEEFTVLQKNGLRYYGTALTANAASTNFATTHESKWGDRFDNLAYKYYNTPTLWWYIAQANGFVNGSMAVPLGTILIIPKLSL